MQDGHQQRLGLAKEAEQRWNVDMGQAADGRRTPTGRSDAETRQNHAVQKGCDAPISDVSARTWTYDPQRSGARSGSQAWSRNKRGGQGTAASFIERLDGIARKADRACKEQVAWDSRGQRDVEALLLWYSLAVTEYTQVTIAKL